MNFGVFVCSTCAGIHREITHKVKGISMSNFTQSEISFILENGNAVRHYPPLTPLELTYQANVRVVPQDLSSAR